MYLEFFGFKEEPFNITPNTRFLYQSKRHREALAALLYGIEHRKGFIALTGEIGCGKTTVCRELLRRLDRNATRIALILNPQLSDVELLQSINGEFGIANSSASKRELLDALNTFLLEENGKGHNCALLIDESQRLSPDALEQVRLISNLETESTKLIQIVLVGQPELDDLLHLPELEQLNQRVTVRHHIDPLDYEEVSEYVAHRLEIAAPSHPVRFHKKALRRVFDFARGVPRRVNVACDRCLLVAFTQGKLEVDDAIAEQAIKEVTSQRRRKKGAPRTEDSGDAIETAGAPSAAPPKSSGSAPLLWVAAAAAALAVAYFATRGDDATAVTPPRALAAATPTPAPAVAAPPVTPSPTPEPTAAMPTATQPPAPSATPDPTATAVPPTETPAPTPEPTAASAEPTLAVLDDGTTGVIAMSVPATPEPVLVATPTPATVFFDSPAEVAPWTYDSAGIMRHPKPEFSYPAAVLTWLARAEDMRFPDAELATLQGLDEKTAQAFTIAPGKAPFFLQTLDLPPSLAALPRGWLPALAQLDRRAPGFGPWCVIVDLDAERVRLLDPRAGIVRADRATVENHLAGVLVPFRDVDGIVGLKPMDRGPAVNALQRLLARGGWFRAPESGLFDPETERAVAAARASLGAPGGPVIDPALAARLLKPLDGAAR